MARVVVGVISDTHGLLRPQVLSSLQKSDYIIHAGDVGDPSILTRLSDIAPLTVVRGNVDHGEWTRTIPPTDVLEVGGASLYVLHNLAELDIKPEAAGIAAVIYGHSHVSKQEIKNGVLYFNPGAAGPRRFNLPVSIGRLIVENGKIQAEVIVLADLL